MTLAERLADAEAAHHALVTGARPVTLTDQNSESVTYTHANRAALSAYIDDLKRQIAGKSAPSVIRFKPTTGT